MDINTTTAQRGGMIGAGGAGPPRSPLTHDVIHSTINARDTAREVAGRLIELRNRLFGAVPESPGASVQKATLDCFQASFEDASASLSYYLVEIDRLSSDLANRL